MGFNYERAVAEMLHNLGHRAEQTVGEGVGLDLWDRFDGQRHRYADGTYPDVDIQNTHCGNVHFAPNGIQHYVRNRNLPVLSDCNDWQNYPNLTGAKQTLNYTDWLGGNARGEMKWCLPARRIVLRCLPQLVEVRLPMADRAAVPAGDRALIGGWRPWHGSSAGNCNISAFSFVMLIE